MTSQSSNFTALRNISMNTSFKYPVAPAEFRHEMEARWSSTFTALDIRHQLSPSLGVMGPAPEFGFPDAAGTVAFVADTNAWPPHIVVAACAILAAGGARQILLLEGPPEHHVVRVLGAPTEDWVVAPFVVVGCGRIDWIGATRCVIGVALDDGRCLPLGGLAPPAVRARLIPPTVVAPDGAGRRIGGRKEKRGEQ
jgi:hypothetical protein